MNAKRLSIAIALIALLLLPACARPQQRPQQSPEKAEQKGGKAETKEKDKEKDPVKEGTEKMRSELDNLRAAVNAGDAAAARKSTRELDETWERIEGKVRARDAEAYDRIERPLHAVVSGVGTTPMDRDVMGDQIEVLDQQLAQVGKSKNSNATASKKVDIRIGTAAMRHHVGQMKANLEKDTAAAQKSARDMDDAWEKFQGDVKKQNKEAYDKIEQAMHNLMAAVQASPLDKKKVQEQLPKLDAQLSELLK
ncbi:MAG TPA: hypothetical protein VD969_28130 [Symbiobacteriaceae bacterium]|nr:hypothetical protein [Symbiobacteriaceae bacterium]